MAIRAQNKHILFWEITENRPELNVFEHPISDNVFPSPKSKSSDYTRRKTGLFIDIPEAKLLFNGMKYAERGKKACFWGAGFGNRNRIRLEMFQRCHDGGL
jgi:hypothetical protein